MREALKKESQNHLHESVWYLGEAPYIFAYYCKNRLPEEVFFGQLTFRSIIQIINNLTGWGYGFSELSSRIAGGQYSGIHKAKEAGADCVKIQTYTPDTLTLNCHKPQYASGGIWAGSYSYDLYCEAYTPFEWGEVIKKECENVGIDFFSAPFDETAVDYLESIGCEFYKIASPELVHIPLIHKVAATGKPIVMSCGKGTPEEIQEALDVCKEEGNEQIVLLKCCSMYPAEYDQMNLSVIPEMAKRYGYPVGLSDHSMGSLADVTAVALGACVIEKHFCLSRAIKNPDCSFSMEPHEFQQMVADVNNAKLTLGDGNAFLLPKEWSSRDGRPSILIAKDIKAGEVFSPENIKVRRPGHGLHSRYYYNIIGKHAAADLEFGDGLKFEDIKESIK